MQLNFLTYREETFSHFEAELVNLVYGVRYRDQDREIGLDQMDH